MTTETTCEYLEWDSAFFGQRIGRVVGNRLSPKTISAVLRWVEAEHIGCIYFLADAGHPQTIALAETNGFRLVDIRLTLDRLIKPSEPVWPGVAAIRNLQAADVPALREIAAVAHRVGRFHSDPDFPDDRCDELYATWIEKSCSGYADIVLVAEVGDSVAGYISCHLSEKGEGSIGLLAVASHFHRRGIGDQLVKASLDFFLANGMTRASVVTQGSNCASQRLYQERGFRTRAVQLWYHRHFR
jgi:dTDP-4-amino-4,6-dideoxy-D-galactose acyltransferase